MRVFKERKIKEKEVSLMKKLRNDGLSYEKIAQQMEVSITTIFYHLNDNFRNKFKASQRKYYSKHGKKRDKEYNKEYKNHRYHTDPKFRRYVIDKTKESQKNLIKIRIEKGLCSSCGEKLKDKKFKQCLKCRIKRRK